MAAAVLEVAANSLASALAAQDGGADRIELCCALELGGLTPSAAQVAPTRERVRLPLHVLVRPRTGDFVYDAREIDVMLRDIESCARLGCEGVVIGTLDHRGNVDVPLCRALFAAAAGLDVTFHRAIDLCREPREALEEIIGLGCKRVLTSGGQPTAAAGASLIAELVELAAGRITVMPGGGIDAANGGRLRRASGASEFHASASHRLHSRQPSAALALAGMTSGELRTDATRVSALAAALRAQPTSN